MKNLVESGTSCKLVPAEFKTLKENQKLVQKQLNYKITLKDGKLVVIPSTMDNTPSKTIIVADIKLKEDEQK